MKLCRRKRIDIWYNPNITDLVVDQGCERKVVEEVCEVLPHVGVSVLTQALVVEAVHLAIRVANPVCD